MEDISYVVCLCRVYLRGGGRGGCLWLPCYRRRRHLDKYQQLLKVLSLFETRGGRGRFIVGGPKKPGTSQTQLFECLDGKK